MKSTYTDLAAPRNGHQPDSMIPAPPPDLGEQNTPMPFPSQESLASAFCLVQRIRQSLDVDAVLQTTVSELRQWLAVDRVFVLQFQADWGGVILVEDRLPTSPSLQGKRVYDECFAEAWVDAYRQGRVQAVADIQRAGLAPCHQAMLTSLGVRANLVVPLQVQDSLWGLLVAQTCTLPRPWQPDEVQTLQQVATQVGLAIEQSELYQQVQVELLARKKVETKLLQQVQRSRDHHLASLGTLAGGLAHDLGEILTPIFLAAEMLNQATLTDRQQQLWLNRIKTSVYRGASLVDQVLSFAQGLAGQRTDLQLAYLLGELVETLTETQSTLLLVTAQLQSSELWTVQADATHLSQVFTNLTSNAYEAMPQGGQIHISAQNYWWRGDDEHPDAAPGPYVTVTVADTGEGMTPEVCDCCCEPFFTTRARLGHSGLGLSTAIGLVKGYGGWLTLQSEVGRGTQVTVAFPASLPKVDLDALRLSLTDLTDQATTVLLLLADTEHREVLRAILESYQATVVWAEEGADALALYIQHQDNLGAVVLDLALPTFNGRAMAHRMGQIAPHIPILTVDSSLSGSVDRTANSNQPSGDSEPVRPSAPNSPNHGATYLAASTMPVLLSTLAQILRSTPVPNLREIVPQNQPFPDGDRLESPLS